MKTFLIVFGIVIAAVLLILFIFGWLLVDFTLVRKSPIFMDAFKIKKIKKTIAVPGTYPELEKKYDDYPLDERVRLMKCEMELDDDHKVLWTQGTDGKKLRAYLYDTPDTHKWIILVHGYGNNAAMMVRMFNADQNLVAKGYKVLLPDLLAHGQSDGKFVSMGYNDRLTVLKWIDEIIKMDKDASIALFGVSMGAATVMITAGEKLPPNVKCIVEDCGYTSADEQFADVIYSAAKLPKNPLIPFLNFFCKLRAGYSLYDASPIEGVKKATVPMFFVHGEEDTFVPTRMMEPLYEACPTEKEKLLIPDAIHAKANKTHPEIYWPRVWSFLEKYV